ncbi:MAG: TonB-dependent receptor [Sphingomonadales bacterium]|nr:TonB-dependent receptor [Sphingomonadales bacterium]
MSIQNLTLSNRRPHFRTTLILPLLLGSTMLGGVATPAFANEPADSQPTAYSFDEIVVTSRRREERLQDIPDSVTAFSSAAIEAADVRQINDVISMVPNISIIEAQDPGLALISIRGVGQERNGEPPVAIVIDGVQMSAADRVNQELYDIERIEVLKGPQGALYGRNAIAGAIVIETVKPDNELAGFIEGRYANGKEVAAVAALRGPIIEDKLFFSLSGNAKSFDGVIENVTLRKPPLTTSGQTVGDPIKVDFADEANLRGRLILHATESLTFDLRASYSDFDGGASYYIPLPPGEPNNTSVPVQNDELGFAQRRLEEYSLKMDYDTDAFSVTSVTAYSITDFEFHEDLEWQPISLFGVDQARYSRSWSQELRITSASDQRLRWMAGVYYLDLHRTTDTMFLLNIDSDDTLDLSIPTVGTVENNISYAAFGQLNYDATEKLELTLALRYDRDRRKQDDHILGNQEKATFDLLQPKFSAAYRWSDSFMTYITAGRGFRSGGFNAPGPVFPLVFKAEKTTNFEIGLKSNFFDNRVLVNAAAFYTKYKNMQQFSLVQSLQGLFNVDNADILGFELEVAAKPTQNLQIDASLGLLDSEIKNFTSTLETAPGVVLVAPGNVIGNQVPRMYGWSTRLGAQYVLPVTAEWELVGRADFTAQGNNYWHVDNLDKEKDRHILDLSLTFQNDSLSVTAYANNVTNHKYSAEFFAQEWLALLTDIRYPGVPRRYGVRVKYNF